MAAVIRLVAERRVVPLIDNVMPISEAADAHRKLEAGLHRGKIVLAL
jgi:NADPH:quinone reductase-like Zn-dependent oxidoreductase